VTGTRFRVKDSMRLDQLSPINPRREPGMSGYTLFMLLVAAAVAAISCDSVSQRDLPNQAVVAGGAGTRLKPPRIRFAGSNVEEGVLIFEITNANDAPLPYCGYLADGFEPPLKHGVIAPRYQQAFRRKGTWKAEPMDRWCAFGRGPVALPPRGTARFDVIVPTTDAWEAVKVGVDWFSAPDSKEGPTTTWSDEIPRNVVALNDIDYDTVAGVLPQPVLQSYRALFPAHHIWQVSQRGKEKDAEFELIIFHPKAGSRFGQQVGDAHVTTIFNYKLVLKGTGEVIREQAHPIAADAVPKAAKDAVDKWKRPLQGRTFSVEWEAHQEPGAERLYSVYVELNAIEAYRATLKADGTFVKGAKAFENYKNP
jgi:hypothetical protein